MNSERSLPRRRLLAGSGAVATLALAGCASSDDGNGNENDSEDEDSQSDSENDSEGDNPDESDDSGDDSGNDSRDNTDDDSEDDTDDSEDDPDSEPNLREANVVDVSVEDDGATHRFDVTLHHDDDGESGYANWWQVERLDGSRLGRRTLLHAHSRQPFTRSDDIGIPPEVDCVVVRGHDQTHGYGGRAALVNLDSGAVRIVEQGGERQSFDAGDCP
jgi:hypothetical protein